MGESKSLQKQDLFSWGGVILAGIFLEEFFLPLGDAECPGAWLRSLRELQLLGGSAWAPQQGSGHLG